VASAHAGDWYVESWNKPLAWVKHDGKTYTVKCRSWSLLNGEEEKMYSGECNLLPAWVGTTMKDAGSAAKNMPSINERLGVMYATDRTLAQDFQNFEIYEIIGISADHSNCK
jgi:hypothetical protein